MFDDLEGTAKHIVSTGVLRVGVYSTWLPYLYTPTDGDATEGRILPVGKVSGFDSELLKVHNPRDTPPTRAKGGMNYPRVLD